MPDPLFTQEQDIGKFYKYLLIANGMFDKFILDLMISQADRETALTQETEIAARERSTASPWLHWAGPDQGAARSGLEALPQRHDIHRGLLPVAADSIVGGLMTASSR